MRKLWRFLRQEKNRQVLGWVGGGAAVIAGGIWAVVAYVWPAHEPAKIVCAQQGSIAAGRDVSGNTINYNGGAPASAGSGAASCADAAKK